MISILWIFLALLCMGYAGIVYMVGSGTFSFAIWLAASGLFCIAFFLSRKGRWGRIPRWLRRVMGICIIAGMSFFLISQILILSHFSDKGDADLDYIIVLGAQMRTSGPSVVFQHRLDAAYTYLEQNPHTLCIVTGGKGSNEAQSEGEGGRDYLIRKGIKENRVLAETKAVDTAENIKNTFEMIRENRQETAALRIGIVTSNFHLFRGIKLAEKEMKLPVSGIAAYTNPLYLPNNMVRECFGILRDLVLFR